MPLYDLSYRRLEGPRTSRLRRSVALARSSTALLMKKRSFLLLVAACWVPAVVRAVQIYVARQFPLAPDFFTVTETTWREFLGQQVRFLPVVLVSLYTGAGAVASDLSSGAIVLYLSKPLSRLDYVLGRLMPVAGAIGFVTLVPALALLALHVALAPDLGFLRSAPFLPLAIAGYSAWLAAYFSLAVLAVSSLSTSGRIAGAGFAALTFGSDVLVRAARSRSGPPSFLSMTGAAVDSGYWFFGDRASGDAPLASIWAMGFVMIVSALVLRRRLASRGALQ